MALHLEHLNPTVRQHMLAEFQADVAAGRLYLSRRFSGPGRRLYPDLLRAAIETGDETTLTNGIMDQGCMEDREPASRGRSKRVPDNAAETLAESEFNRFYIRGLCLAALAQGIQEVVVYRAKHVFAPRDESRLLIGRHLSARELLEDLRLNIGEGTRLGVPGGPNSGLSVRLPAP